MWKDYTCECVKNITWCFVFDFLWVYFTWVSLLPSPAEALRVVSLAFKDAAFTLDIYYATQLTDLYHIFLVVVCFLRALKLVRYRVTPDGAQIAFLILNSKPAAVQAGVANWFLWDCHGCTDIPDPNSIFKRAKETQFRQALSWAGWPVWEYGMKPKLAQLLSYRNHVALRVFCGVTAVPWVGLTGEKLQSAHFPNSSGAVRASADQYLSSIWKTSQESGVWKSINLLLSITK